MTTLIPVLDRSVIAQTVEAIAQRIASDYKDLEPVLIGILKGAFIFMADLVRQLDLKRFEIDFVQAASYGDNLQSSGQIKLLKDVGIDISGKDVLLIEDILDTGLTLNYLVEYLKTRNPRSVKICTLIDKYERRQIDIKADYVGHKVEKGFLVGYGLDYAEAYRNLPDIYHLKM